MSSVWVWLGDLYVLVWKCMCIESMYRVSWDYCKPEIYFYSILQILRNIAFSVQYLHKYTPKVLIQTYTKNIPFRMRMILSFCTCIHVVFSKVLNYWNLKHINCSKSYVEAKTTPSTIIKTLPTYVSEES